MIKKIAGVIFALPSIIIATTNNQKHFDIGLSGGYYQYKEPEAMKVTGMTYALHSGANYTFDSSVFFAIKAMVGFSPKLKYKTLPPFPPGEINNVKNHYFDVSPRIGYNFISHSDMQLTGYLGYGYEHLKYKSDQVITILRWQEYHYAIIGAQFKKQLDNQWLIESDIDLNWMFYGKNKTVFKSIPGSGIRDTIIKVTQKDGFGIKVDLMLGQDYNYWGWRAGVYFRGWDIKQSSDDRGDVEPKNTTYDTGLKVKFTF